MLQRLSREAVNRRALTAAAAAAAAPLQAGLQRPAQGTPAASAHGLRFLHSGRPDLQANLGVVDKLRDEAAIQLPAPGRRSFWQVVELRADGTALETWKTPEVLCLHPRDVHLFTSDAGFSQRAYIAPRSSAILFKTSVCKAIIYADKMVLFPAKRLPDTVRIAQAVKSAISQRSGLPFELRVLEALLAEATRALEGKCKRLGVVAESVIAEINANFHSSAGELQRLLPIQRKLNEVERDVEEVAEAVGGVVDDDATLRKIALSERAAMISSGAHTDWGSSLESAEPLKDVVSPPQPKQQAAPGGERWREAPPAQQRQQLPSRPVATSTGPASPVRSPHMRMAATILESYEAKLQGANAALRELLETIEQTRTVWHMQLDHQRNRILRVNLLLSIFGFGGLTAGLVPAFFGMNLPSGMEAADGIFFPTVGASLSIGGAAALGMYIYYKVGPKRRYQARLRDMRSLRDLLTFHLEDLETIVDCIKARGGVSQAEFKDIVTSAIKSSRPPSAEEIALLWRVFDTNRDGFLELTEVVRLEDHMQAHEQTADLSHHMT